MRKITLTLFALATISTSALTSCEAIERCCKGDKGCTTESKAAAVCSHCGKTSCTATCTAHGAVDSTKNHR